MMMTIACLLMMSVWPNCACRCLRNPAKESHFFAPFEYRFMARTQRRRRPVTGDKLLGSASKRYNANCPLTHWCQLGSWTAAETPIEMKE